MRHGSPNQRQGLPECRRKESQAEGDHRRIVAAKLNVCNGWWSQEVVATLYLLRGEVSDDETTTTAAIHPGGGCGGFGSLAAGGKAEAEWPGIPPIAASEPCSSQAACRGS